MSNYSNRYDSDFGRRDTLAHTTPVTPQGSIVARVMAELVHVRPNDLLHPFTDPRIAEEMRTRPSPQTAQFAVGKRDQRNLDNADSSYTQNTDFGSRRLPSREYRRSSTAETPERSYRRPTSATSENPFAESAGTAESANADYDKPSTQPKAAPRSHAPSRAISTAITAEAFSEGLAPLVVGDAGAEVDPVVVDAKFGTGRNVPDTVIDGWRSNEFVLRSVSLRGRMHRYNGAPRQDSVLTRLSDDGKTLFVAVADGVSAAPQSHRGSEIAAKYAVGWMLQKYSANLTAADWQSLAKGASYSIQNAARETSADPMDFASTLVCAAVTRHGEHLRGHVLSIGDSGSWLVGPNGVSLIEGGKDEGDAMISSSAVRPLPVVPDDLNAVYFESATDETVLLGTDGIGDPLGGGGGPLSELFVKRLFKRVPSITEFCHLVDFSKAGFDDDRSLIAIWPPHLGLPDK